VPAGGPHSQTEADRVAPIVVRSHADIVEIIARLSGEGFEERVRSQARFSTGDPQYLSKMTATGN
jgi:hypothetical protein